MKFTNTEASVEVKFTVMGKSYTVAPGGEVDIDPKHVPFVLRRGVKLEVSKPKPPAPKPVVKVEKKAPTPEKILEIISKPIPKPEPKPEKPTAPKE